MTNTGADLFYKKIQRGNPSRLIFLLHGYGKSYKFMEDEILNKIKNDNAIFILPNAPHVYHHPDQNHTHDESFYWFSLHDLNFPKMAPSIQETGHLVGSFVKKIASELEIPFSKVVMCGFSQGAMLSCQVGTTLDEKVGGVISLSGLFTFASTHGENINRDINYTIIHGDADTAVPISHAHKAIEGLQTITANAELRIIRDMDHEVNQEVADIVSECIDRYTA